VTSLACALSIDTDMLIGMRALQGVGAALMVPGSLAIIAKAYPAEERGQAIGTWAAFSSLTTAGGPFLGGVILSFGGDWMWRLIFAINVPIGLIALAMLYFRVPKDSVSGQRRLDIPGAALATVSLGAIAWGLTSFGAPEAQRVGSPHAWLAVGIAIGAAFLWWEHRAREPMVKLDLFRSKAFNGANAFTFVLWLAFTAVVFFFPMTIVAGWGESELEASVVGLPLSLMIFTFSGAAGRLADRIGPRLPLTLGALLLAVSYVLVGLTMPMMDLWRVTLPLLVLQGAGMALLVSPVSAAVMLATPDSDTGLASGINHAVARAAGLIAVAGLGSIAGIVFNNVYGGAASGVEFGALPAAPLPADAEALRVAASNAAFEAICYAASVLCLVSAAIAWFTQPSKSKS